MVCQLIIHVKACDTLSSFSPKFSHHLLSSTPSPSTTPFLPPCPLSGKNGKNKGSKLTFMIRFMNGKESGSKHSSNGTSNGVQRSGIPTLPNFQLPQILLLFTSPPTIPLIPQHPSLFHSTHSLQLYAENLRRYPLISVIPRPRCHHIDMPECRRLSVRVANVAGVFADDVTDLAVGLLIHVVMSISAAHRCAADLARR